MPVEPHLDYARTPAGSLQIAARQDAHDDRAMSLMQAVSCIRQQARPDAASWPPMFDHVVTGRGTFMPGSPRPVEHSTSFFRTPGGREHGTESAW